MLLLNTLGTPVRLKLAKRARINEIRRLFEAELMQQDYLRTEVSMTAVIETDGLNKRYGEPYSGINELTL